MLLRVLVVLRSICFVRLPLEQVIAPVLILLMMVFSPARALLVGMVLVPNDELFPMQLVITSGLVCVALAASRLIDDSKLHVGLSLRIKADRDCQTSGPASKIGFAASTSVTRNDRLRLRVLQ